MTSEFIRLDTVAPDLTRRLKGASTDELREISKRVVRAALTRTGVQEPRIDAALAALQVASFGDAIQLTALSSLESELDNVGWDQQERMSRGMVTEAEYDRAFARARAWSALWFALERDPLTSALQGVYEAIAATDLREIRSIIDGVLGDQTEHRRS